MRGLLFASGVIVLLAVSVPSYFARYMGQPGADGAGASTHENMAGEETPQAPQSSGRQFEVKAARDGHFYLDADINFRPVHFIVDTGATVVALRQSDAVTAGIRVLPADFLHPVQTANGTTNAAEAMLDSVAISDIEVRNVRALVLPDDQLSISLLGSSFLNNLQHYDVTGGVLVIEN